MFRQGKHAVSAGYPYEAGWKGTETSREAASSISEISGHCRVVVLNALRGSLIGMTSREIAAFTNIDIDTVKPRISELRADDLIYDSGERRKESKFKGGALKNVIVWRAK
jgi:hypothetical protein